MNPENIINLEQHPIQESDYSKSCKDQLDSTGALVIKAHTHGALVGSRGH